MEAPMKKTRWKFVVYAILSVGAVVLVSGVVFLFYPDTFINTFLKGRITEGFRKAYPEYSIRIGRMHYDIRENRIVFDSLALTTKDSSLYCTVASYSASQIGWLELLWARGLVPSGFTGTVLDAHGIVVNFPLKNYELRFEQVRVSVPDSGMAVKGLSLHPSGGDERLFSRSKFRQTRFRIAVPHAAVTGLACLELLQGKGYRARSVSIGDPFLDVLINKEKAARKETSSPLMPHQIFALIKEHIEVDSVNVWNAALKYGERIAPGIKPAVITLEAMQVSVVGIDTHGETGNKVEVVAKGTFMRSGEMNLRMSLPLSSPDVVFQYSGSVGRMDLSALNPFLETAEQVRIKEGVLFSGTFDINVRAGHATGGVRTVYKNLRIAAINKHTGSEGGVFDAIASFVANNVTIRSNNIPDNSGAMKIGTVNYTRQEDDAFFQFAWFALRSGLGDVVGF